MLLVVGKIDRFAFERFSEGEGRRRGAPRGLDEELEFAGFVDEQRDSQRIDREQMFENRGGHMGQGADVDSNRRWNIFLVRAWYM